MNGLRVQMSAPMAPAPLSAPPPSSSSSFTATAIAGPRFPPPLPYLISPLSLNLLIPPSQPPPPPPPPLQPRPPPPDYHPEPILSVGRVRLADILPYDGAPGLTYLRAVEVLSGSLTRHNAVVIELGNEDVVAMRCALESVRMLFRARAQRGSDGGAGNLGKSSRGFYTYRAGRPVIAYRQGTKSCYCWPSTSCLL